MPSIRSRARTLLLVLTLVFVVFCSVPYVIGALRTPDGTRFTGLVFDPFDQEYYLASIRSGLDDLNPNRFSAERDAPGPVAQQYPLLGRAGDPLGLGPLFLYHAPRVLSSLLLPVMLSVLMRLCFPGNNRLALIATVFALFATGLGSLSPAILPRPTGDHGVIEATLIRSVTVYPHFAVAYAGVTASLVAVVLALRRTRWRRAVAWGLAGGSLLAVSHAFLLLPMALCMAVVGAGVSLDWVRRRDDSGRLFSLVAAGAAIAAPAIPFLLVLRTEMSRFEAVQGHPFPATPSTGLWTWLAAYALLLPPALAGAATLVGRRQVSGAAPGIDRVAIGVLVSFLVAEAVLIFLPALPFQRRFSEGLIIPLAALAAAGVSRWPGVQIPLAAVVIALAALSTTRFAHDGTYLPQARWRAFGALTEEDVVLAGGLLSPRIPAFSSATVYAARPVETVHFPAKLKFREVFRRNPTSPDVWRELRSSGVNLVITDSADGTFDVPDSLLPTDCFQPAFRFGPLSAYRLRPGCPVP